MTSSINNKASLSQTFFTKLGAAGLVALGLTLSACQGGGAVNGHIDLIDMRSETLLSTDLESVNGTYGAGCTNRSGAWSVEIEPDATLDNPELSVLLNDVGCVLTLTELRTTEGAIAAVPAIVLGTAYEAAPSEFDDPVEFYANAKMSSVSYASDFVLTILYSDDPNSATDDNNAEFDVVQSSAEGDSVAAPNYTIDVSGLEVIVDVDQVVQSATGNVALSAGSVTGQTYAVVDASGLATYAAIDAAYLGATPVAIAGTVPAAAFSLVGEDLSVPEVRTLIIANIEEGVASYQTFAITFHPAI